MLMFITAGILNLAFYPKLFVKQNASKASCNEQNQDEKYQSLRLFIS